MFLFSVCACLCVYVCHSVLVEIRRQLRRVRSPLLLCGSQKLYAGCQPSQFHLYLLSHLRGFGLWIFYDILSQCNWFFLWCPLFLFDMFIFPWVLWLTDFLSCHQLALLFISPLNFQIFHYIFSRSLHGQLVNTFSVFFFFLYFQPPFQFFDYFASHI